MRVITKKSYYIDVMTGIICAIALIALMVFTAFVLPKYFGLVSIIGTLAVIFILPLAGIIPLIRSHKPEPKLLKVVVTTAVIAIFAALFSRITIYDQVWELTLKLLYVAIWLLASMLIWSTTVRRRIQSQRRNDV